MRRAGKPALKAQRQITCFLTPSKPPAVPAPLSSENSPDNLVRASEKRTHEREGEEAAARAGDAPDHLAKRPKCEAAQAAQEVGAPAGQPAQPAAGQAELHDRFQRKLVSGMAITRKERAEEQRQACSTEPAPGAKLTPLEQQVFDLKRQHPGVLLIVEVWPGKGVSGRDWWTGKTRRRCRSMADCPSDDSCRFLLAGMPCAGWGEGCWPWDPRSLPARGGSTGSFTGCPAYDAARQAQNRNGSGFAHSTPHSTTPPLPRPSAATNFVFLARMPRRRLACSMSSPSLTTTTWSLPSRPSACTCTCGAWWRRGTRWAWSGRRRRQPSRPPAPVAPRPFSEPSPSCTPVRRWRWAGMGMGGGGSCVLWLGGCKGGDGGQHKPRQASHARAMARCVQCACPVLRARMCGASE